MAGYKITFDMDGSGLPITPNLNELIFAENKGFVAHVNNKEIQISVGKTYVDDKIDSVTIQGALVYKGSVTDFTTLQAMTGMQLGDYYQTEDTGIFYLYNGTDWIETSSLTDLSDYYTKEDIDSKLSTSGNASELQQSITDIQNQLSSLVLSSAGGSNYRTNVTGMFSLNPYVQDFQIWYDDDQSGNPQIVVRGQRSLTDTTDLIITAPLGMGSYIPFDSTNPKVVFGVATDGNSFGLYPITITQEFVNNPTTITIPANVKNFEFSYFVRSTAKSSYWVDTNGVAYTFNISNTPITNFATNRTGNETGTYTINGLNVVKKNITAIVFGDDYLTVTSLGNYFLNYMYGLQRADFSGLTNVTTTGTYFLSDSQCPKLDLRPFSNLRTASTYMCSGNRQTLEVDVSTWNNINTGAYPFSYIPLCTMIKCGGVDVTTGNWQAAYNFYQIKNDTTVTRVHDTQDLANKWNTRFPSMAAQTIIIDPTRGGTI